MKAELQKQLFDKYPEIFSQKDLPMSQTCMCWGIECGGGWFNIIDQLCAAIMNRHENEKRNNPGHTGMVLQATQVKEKYGGLRFYTNGHDDYVDGLIDMAERMSECTCEKCGDAGKPNDAGWISTLCDKCRSKKNEAS